MSQVVLIHWKAAEAKDRERTLGRLPENVWIAWPKKASGVVTDLTQQGVRNKGLDCGLVDYKIAAIDKTWSGLRFARRRR